MPATPLLYLIDGSSQMYRAYHAPVRTAEGGLLRNAQGTPTNAVYIFVTMLRKLMNDHKPEYIAASFDLPGRTFRDDLVDDYKANRRPMPDELAQQITMVHAACEALGVPILTSERYEADDVIGTLAEKASAAGFDVAIVTMDKDFFQLVREGIRVFNPRDEGTWYDAAAVKEKFGVSPGQVVDVLALMGDTIDNIKGVTGIGEKGARDLIATYGSLDELIAHAPEVAQRRYREPLLANIESARQSRELARIRTDVPVEFDPTAGRYRGASRERCFDIFNELGFRTLSVEYAPTAGSVAKTYRVINTAAGVEGLAARLRAAGRFALRVLPDHPSAMRASIVGMAFSTAPRDADYVPIGHRALGEAASLPLEAAVDYAGERADLAGQLAPIFGDLLAKEQLAGVYATLELPLIPVLVAVERAGVRIDGVSLAAQSKHIEQELSIREAQIHELAGESFNINSPKQLSTILFDKLKLPTLQRGGKTSTAVEILQDLALAHDLPRLILEWRALMKLKGTYIDALPQLVNPDTGRVHTCFNQAVAATGRLSSSDPNLQNIPIKTPLGREIRGAFIAEPDSVLISADYSQIELRVLAHLADEEALIEAFRRGEDIHDRTALKVFGPDSPIDAHKRRGTAKMINYALLYGKSRFTLAKDIGVTPEEAQEFIDAYFAGFPRVRAFIERTLEEARSTGIVKTMYGRRRLVPELHSRDLQRRAAAEREAVNLPIQGTAADILKRAMIDTHAALAAEPGARMILTVHDELLFEVPNARAEQVAELVQDRMQSAAALKVPLTVDVGIGKNWKDAKS